MIPLVASEIVSRSAWNIVINHKGEVLIARRSRKSNKPKQWNFPGGGIEGAEQPLESAMRELKEEMGIKRAEVELIGSHDISTRDRNMYVFIWGTNTDGKISLKVNKKESDKTAWLSMKKLAEESKKPGNWHFPTFMMLHNPMLFDNLKSLCNKRVEDFKARRDVVKVEKKAAKPKDKSSKAKTSVML